MEIQELQGINHLIKSAMTLFDNMLLPEVCSKQNTIVQQNYEVDENVTAGKCSLSGKAMGYMSIAMKAFCKSDQFLYLHKDAATSQLFCMHNYLRKPQELGIHITSMHVVKEGEEMKYLTRKH